MPTTVRIGRSAPHTKSDLLRQDDELWQLAQRLGGWLGQRDAATLTHSAVLTWALQEDAGATLTPEAVWYEWVWDPIRDLWYQVCHDRSTILLPSTGANPIEVTVDIAASY
jgi:hypothetical protein